MSEHDRSVVVLVSGGIDSVTALYAAREDARVAAALSFRYGSKHHARELPLARWHCERLGVPYTEIDIPFVAELFHSHLLEGGGEIPRGHYEEETMRQTVVPFRNGIFIAVAAGFAESAGVQGLVIAAHTGDHAIYPDCREGFMQSMADAVRLGTYAKIELLRPFIGWTKAEIVARGAKLGIDYGQTWSCYVGGERHCGECGTCVERREAFLLAGVPDPTDYVSLAPLPTRPVAKAG